LRSGDHFPDGFFKLDTLDYKIVSASDASNAHIPSDAQDRKLSRAARMIFLQLKCIVYGKADDLHRQDSLL
jgi:hypothetical protein